MSETNRELSSVVSLMRRSHGVELSAFDTSFLNKTIGIRSSECGFESVSGYASFLAHDGQEAAILSQSCIVSYSEFFRDTVGFALLEKLIIPELIKNTAKTGRPEIRVWSAACAEGQEAYSLAILFLEALAAGDSGLSFRIFATDISSPALAVARRGIYSNESIGNVRHKHLCAYFTPHASGWQISSRVSEHIAFSSYDLLDEHSSFPSACVYGDLDLVLMNNILFYYKPDIQKLIAGKALRSLACGGFLSTSEAEAEYFTAAGMLEPVAPPHAVFRKPPKRTAG